MPKQGYKQQPQHIAKRVRACQAKPKPTVQQQVEQDIVRFESKFQKTDGCWLWQGGCDQGGYGYINVQKKRFAAHRFAYNLYTGAIPKGLFVCHHCDTPACVNPSHLFVGTAQDNMTDMVSKGRSKLGKRYPKQPTI